MASAYAFGYMLAVPVLTTLTDRIDARRILLAGSASSGLATAPFGLFADGLWSATLIWALAGIGFAGAYMPGLKALADRLPVRRHLAQRHPLYGSFSIGVGLSFLVSQLAADACWAGARPSYSPALGPLVMVAVCLWLAPVTTGACAGRPARLPAGSAQSRRARLHPGLRRALLRALRHAHLDRRLLDFCRGANDGCAARAHHGSFIVARCCRCPRACSATRRLCASADTAPSSPSCSPRRPSHWRSASVGRLAAAAAGARAHLRLHHSRRFRRAYLRHDGKRRAGLSRGDPGAAFDGRVRPFGAGRLGRRRGARCGGRAGAAGRMVRLVRTARGRSSFRSHRLAMVTARTRDRIIATKVDAAVP